MDLNSLKFIISRADDEDGYQQSLLILSLLLLTVSLCLLCNINIINQTDWQSLSGASVRVSRLPVPLSCCPRCKRLLWRRAPECVQLPQPHPGCGSLTEPAPAGAGCGSWLGLQGVQLGGLQQEGKQICERCDKEKNNSNDLNMNFIVKILQLYFLLQDKKF